MWPWVSCQPLRMCCHTKYVALGTQPKSAHHSCLGTHAGSRTKAVLHDCHASSPQMHLPVHTMSSITMLSSPSCLLPDYGKIFECALQVAAATCAGCLISAAQSMEALPSQMCCLSHAGPSEPHLLTSAPAQRAPPRGSALMKEFFTKPLWTCLPQSQLCESG